MKKILFALAVALITIFLFCWVALGEAVIEVAAEVAQGAEAIADIAKDAKAGTLPVEPFTWVALGTIAGCTAFALLFVQLIKAPLDKVWKIPTRALVYAVCLVVMLVSVAFTDGLSWQSGLLAAVNAVIPTLAAMGAYEMTFGKRTEPPDK